ncbi:MAG: regulatory protein RecX [Pseudomonadota bacterium]|nr:regulatory protein RecX [Pseudomonadota bacterium]
MKRAEDFLEQLKQDGKFELDPSGNLKDQESDAQLGSETSADQARNQLRQQIESRAVMLLAIREHGAKELKTKLIKKFPETESMLSETQEPAGLVKILVEEVIESCQENNWQSDERYIEQAVRSLMEKGQGPMKIRQKCQQACQNSTLIEAYLEFESEEWLEMAKNVMLKKYGDLTKPASRNEQAKRMRFLQGRGFSSEVIWKVYR